MKIIEIASDENGAHAYQTISVDIPLPDGYALVPDDMEIPDTIPYVNIEVEDGVVTKMTAGTVPEAPETPEQPQTIQEQIDDLQSAVVELAYNQVLADNGIEDTETGQVEETDTESEQPAE